MLSSISLWNISPMDFGLCSCRSSIFVWFLWHCSHGLAALNTQTLQWASHGKWLLLTWDLTLLSILFILLVLLFLVYTTGKGGLVNNIAENSRDQSTLQPAPAAPGTGTGAGTWKEQEQEQILQEWSWPAPVKTNSSKEKLWLVTYRCTGEDTHQSALCHSSVQLATMESFQFPFSFSLSLFPLFCFPLKQVTFT